MPDFFSLFYQLLCQYIDFFPLVALVALLLAGFSLPFSEDLIIIMGALLCQEDPALLVPTLAAIYAGVIASDFIAYRIGIMAGKGSMRNKLFAALFEEKKLNRMHKLMEKYGIFTFIVCRFIPFGVRNTLFMASGFFRLRPRVFALFDIPSAAISVSTLFFLAYNLGDDVKHPVKVAGLILFILLILIIAALFIRFLVKKGVKLPLTPYGLPQVLIFPLLVVLLMAGLFFLPRGLWLVPGEAALFLVLIWTLSFFRDPPRKIREDESILYSPADGRVTDIFMVEDSPVGRALRIGIFLSIFNVHLNRAPCSVRVECVSYRKGMHRDARRGDSGQVNESNDLVMSRLSFPGKRLMVRQISGAIARHIVCRVKAGDELRQGELFGMIKFGSRTELYIGVGKDESCGAAVRIGDPVRAGLTPLVRYAGSAR
ncbi:MAG: phosphatidylserine decarboxylase [Treponema sp.]|jgi:phosphatidylserine decarboxylase precursor-related protein|nr:phosphatidylserine decarboxylase [Treponema sp.]